MSTDQAAEALQQLMAAWQLEREAARLQARKERYGLDLSERVARGIALRGLVLSDTDAAAGGRVILWLDAPRGAELREIRLSSGEPVRLWTRDPEGEEVESGVIGRVERQRLSVIVSEHYGEFVERGALNLDREAPEVTFERGQAVLVRLLSAAASGGNRTQGGSDLAKRSQALLVQWRELLFADRRPRLPPPRAAEPAFGFLDEGLNESQRAAVRFSLDAPELALVHGPPGTGKTRTLVEIVRQAVRRSERVLLTAASNTAVDNLAERLIAHGVPLVRLGHPARVSSAVSDHTLDAQIETSDARRLAKRLTGQANELRRRADKRRARGTLAPGEGRELFTQARQLMAEARGQLDLARELVLGAAKVVCATAAGADPQLLARLELDRVILDEATQAVDPLALIPLTLAPRCVLAGDPQQLSPTVLSDAAARAGLSRTLFERLAESHPSLVQLLDTQYRMHAQLMQFPSQSMYGGKLIAAAEVAARQLHDLPGVSADPLRPGPLVFLDTAGKGWTEERSENDPSTHNPGQAERTALEVRRIVARGLPASELALITPYDAQARRLRDQLRDLVDLGLEVGSVDGFQGREKEAIVVDLVRSNDEGQVGFLRDVRRMNVALTRAKRFLLVVGDSATLSHVAYYRDFMSAADSCNASVSAWSDDGVS